MNDLKAQNVSAFSRGNSVSVAVIEYVVKTSPKNTPRPCDFIDKSY